TRAPLFRELGRMVAGCPLPLPGCPLPYGGLGPPAPAPGPLPLGGVGRPCPGRTQGHPRACQTMPGVACLELYRGQGPDTDTDTPGGRMAIGILRRRTLRRGTLRP